MTHSTTPAPVGESGARRRDIVLDVATDLFRRRGFHRVGIADIGAAAGITGPGVYRHFPSKDAVLVAIFDEVADRLIRAAQRIVTDGTDPLFTLRALIEFHVDFTLGDRAVIAVYHQEQRNLPDLDRRRIRRRQRSYLGHWIDTLLQVRPGLPQDDAIALVHAAISVVLSATSYESNLDPAHLRNLLVDRAMLVLATDPPAWAAEPR